MLLWSVVLDLELGGDPAWLQATELVLGFLQTVILAYLAGQQHASSQERHRRRRDEGLE